MNSKLSNKPSKKDRPKSTDKVVRSKKKGDQTPDKITTPVPLSMVEDLNCNEALNNVLSGEDIESLAVNMTELLKHRPSKPSKVERSTRQVRVKKTIKLKNDEHTDKKTWRIVNVGYRKNLDDPEFHSYEKIGNKDPYLDNEEPFYEHHILGSLLDFKEQSTKHHNAKRLPTPHHVKTFSSMPESNGKTTKTGKPHFHRFNMNQSNALVNWEKQIAERRKQQASLAKLLKTTPEMLGMNQNEGYRRTQEERYLIERTIPSKDYGKGYRTGSEFWRQSEQIGDDKTGIHMTLTQTERGYPSVVEHVGKPLSVRAEMGMNWPNTESYRSMMVHSPWKKSSYLCQRKNELKDAIDEICPHKPYLQELEVVGQSLDNEVKVNSNVVEDPYSRMETFSAKQEETKNDINTDPLSMHPDVYPQPVFGPSLMIAGRSAKWNGSTNNRLGEIGVSCRVLLEAQVNERVISTLDLHNNGTAVVYYSWKHVPMNNNLGTNLAGKQQRFYFDKNSGVILPGDKLSYPFIFKSTNPGMFSQQWFLETQPILNGGAAISVLLKGLALQDDLNAEKRAEIERILGRRQAKQIVESILKEILGNIRSPERSVSPVDAYITEEDIFARRNQEISYDEETVQSLKLLYNEIESEKDWDLNLTSLRQLITSKEFDEKETLDEYLRRLNDYVKKLAFPSRVPIKEEMYSTCYFMLCEMIDDLVIKSDMMRTSMGLPMKDMVEDTTANDKKSKKNDVARLTAEKKDGRKDKKSAYDRPVSRAPGDKTKSSRGSPNVQTRLFDNETPEPGDSLVVSTTTEDTNNDKKTVNLVHEEKYREKYFVQAKR
ncbi:MYCBP-associated protein-like [Xenia sp. Carnegie-2017]|uniref:MYCBP-associated protein-like n=1 Tax=Xenia sp. Carnegie-2017 TaxID=2897299 RepID=UPI001F04784A|nr:MYCBP-associated protein-like [Xenia sp. Carnegie-2017]